MDTKEAAFYFAFLRLLQLIDHTCIRIFIRLRPIPVEITVEQFTSYSMAISGERN